MKYVYVLTSDENDYYLEQALMSIASLKMVMPHAFVALLIDDVTEKTFTGNRGNIRKLVDELRAVEIDKKYKKVARSRWLKTSMRQLIEGDFLYIDCDTIISGDLSEITEKDIALGGVADNHQLFSEYSGRDYVFSIMKFLNFPFSPEPQYYINGGLLFCRDAKLCYDFFAEWHRLWILCTKKNIFIDQISLNMAHVYFNQCIHEIGGIWNCQVQTGGLVYLFDAKILHYWSSRRTENPYMLGRQFIFEGIRNNGITPELQNMMKNPKCLFAPASRVISDRKILLIIDTFDFILKKPALLNLIRRILLRLRIISGSLKIKISV